jgi:alpha-ribazole phosphatase
MRLDLIRHGETGRHGFLDGRTDVPLTAEGWRQLDVQTQDMSARTVISSHLKRARAFASDLATRTGVWLTIDEGWAELDFGAWDGRRWAEIEGEGDGREQLVAFYSDPTGSRPPGGENWADFEARVLQALDRALVEAQSGHVLVIAHGGPIRCALAQLLGMPFASTWAFRIDYGTRLTFDVGRQDNGEPWARLVEMTQAPSAKPRS